MRSDLGLLTRLIEHARSELRRMDPDEVPTGLRRVAAHSGPRLPPPLIRKLVSEIDESEWLRARLAASWLSADENDAGTLFLHRPDGWEDAMEALAAAAEHAALADRISELEQEVGALRDDVERARRRARRAQREAEMATAEADKRVTAARSAASAGRQGESEELKQLRGEASNLRRAIEAAGRDLESSRARVRSLRAELLRARRATRPDPVQPSTPVWADLNPIRKAKLIDDMREAFSPATEFEDLHLPIEADPLRLPAGVSPDDRASIVWLVSLGRPVVIVVDGYNVTHLLAPDQPTASGTRDRLNRDLARLRRLGTATPRVVVVYDSSIEGGITSERGPEGVEIRFTSDGHTADDEILYLATELGSSAVVVTSDRRVREGAERLGSLGLWSEALVAWIRES
ncbi:MAG: NYN domain-containing protein [Acidimicrobiia bacterium]|nr:NYN domain-containing protein [Acidimicrobiia bacterium]